jgi:hypothetical protein
LTEWTPGVQQGSRSSALFSCAQTAVPRLATYGFLLLGAPSLFAQSDWVQQSHGIRICELLLNDYADLYRIRPSRRHLVDRSDKACAQSASTEDMSHKCRWALHSTDPKCAPAPLSRTQVHRMLRNEFYVGVVTWDGVKNAEARHEPIIDRATFEKVEQVLKSAMLSGNPQAQALSARVDLLPPLRAPDGISPHPRQRRHL